MKKIGLIGGTGPESTLMYYRELTRRLHRMSGERAFPEIVIESLDMCRTSVYMAQERYDKLAEYLISLEHNLENCGARVTALTAVTMHAVFDELKNASHVPLIGIPDAAAAYAAQRGYRRVGMLGTIFTMEKDYLKRAFTERGIDIVVPGREERELVHDRIFTQLEYGVVKDETVRELTDIIQKMRDESGIQAVVLGCTELPLALNDGNCPVPCLDCVEIHLNRLTEEAM